MERIVARFILWWMCAVIFGVQLAALAQWYFDGRWLVDAAGLPIMNDFTGLWSAGLMALNGHALSVYDWSATQAFQARVMAPHEGFLPYPYPPTYLLLLAPLAALPYQAAF